jgi:hypothetical protein
MRRAAAFHRSRGEEAVAVHDSCQECLGLKGRDLNRTAPEMDFTRKLQSISISPLIVVETRHSGSAVAK